jgi:hypothetical protein
LVAEVRASFDAAGRGVRPAAQSLSFAWPEESNQRKGHPTICVPSLRYGQPAVLGLRGVWRNSPSAQTCASPDPRTPALLGAARGGPKSDILGALRHRASARQVGCSAVGISSCRVASASSARLSGSGLALFERSEFSQTPLSLSNAACPKRSAGTTTSARLFFGDFLLAKQKKVTALPGAFPGL